MNNNDQPGKKKKTVALFTDEQIEKTKSALQALKEPPPIKDIRWAIEQLKADINGKLKSRMTYKQIAPTVYQSLGVTEDEYKLEQFWRVLSKLHKPNKTGGRNVVRAGEKQLKAPLDPADNSTNNSPDPSSKKPTKSALRAAKRTAKKAVHQQNTPVTEAPDPPQNQSTTDQNIPAIEPNAPYQNTSANTPDINDTEPNDSSINCLNTQEQKVDDDLLTQL